MAGPIHTYGPTCFLADDEPDLTAWQSSPTPPKIRTQFFYTSSLPIDDPLTPLPPLSTGSGSANERFPPQPFSARDNAALEDAWRSLRQVRERKAATQARKQTQSLKGRSGIIVPEVRRDLNQLRRKAAGSVDDVSSTKSHSQGSSPRLSSWNPDDSSSPTYRAHLHDENSSAESPTKGTWQKQHIRITADDEQQEGSGNISSRNRKQEGSLLGSEIEANKRIMGSFSRNEELDSDDADGDSLRGDRSRNASISGSPFIRAPLGTSSSPLTRSQLPSSSNDAGVEEFQPDSQATGAGLTSSRPAGEQTVTEVSQPKNGDDEDESIIPVGVSRLHLVELPSLKMKPIYWSPLHDISDVIRATWFYKNTLLPVETEIANKLEEGYDYLKPWTETWQDELNSCVENGADAELKVVHQLWSKDDVSSTSRPGTSENEATNQIPGEAEESPDSKRATGLIFEDNHAAGGTAASQEVIKPYLNSSVIYVDAKDAQILRPSLLPSVARGRKPLSAIRKGRQIGVPVVRGFSRRAWDQLHPSKPNPVDVRHYLRRTQSIEIPRAHGGEVCYACAMEESRPNPTDLVLVIHGIGQKLSERMESFHFTYAINSLRRNVNIELHNEPVWSHVRPDHGGIMVLPVNWRSTLSLDDANLEVPSTEDPASNRYSLEDITPETIPAVRSLISDVMLDIPYYLSHHKPKMIQAVVKEANRIYRLWCHNNHGFQENGKVHLIAHSLGSVMALDVLSHQPTRVPKFDFSTIPVHKDIFEFDTGNLFLCGSPSGFFLLLNKANLLPRRDRNKPGSEGEDRHRGVAGEADTYGCVAVDNLYNIMHTTDPIAYRVNAAVDCDLASSLKAANIHASSASLLQSFGNVFRWSSASTIIPSSVSASRPVTISKLPSTVEMETHDFTREEIAEKRMFLLNDNGQIDFFLSGGGGPLNIQYLNMLSAHSSYWTLTDFVRFFVVEIARKQGRDGTLPVFRAEKKKGWKVHRDRPIF
ncbi:hypothetical protein ASPZODRAFT_127139 [Penicilliopsis zonata CBS 506.65]|uniref:DDHD domain-containing protein n=1 Tax=Penicilliopsis zonata CBS 506.65 TaxID=1073090 RepID=A0A1L9SVL5_9EURO|nr:hypothetical protein ASPZODRAFT_127139 [Penicilliopsis zonata CBS 506.65]OJJ51127.1 hypothetical protein ASPZODRAFT_127139 [Penicilliopsis zonata CBS 506.65]